MAITRQSSVHVMDACALTAWIRREQGADVIDELFSRDGNTSIVHAINLCEVYYDSYRDALKALPDADAVAAAKQIIQDIGAVGINSREDMDPAFWQLIGRLKVKPGKLSLADCFAIALAIRLGATLVTSDHHEFDAIVPLDLCPILFFR